MAYVVIKTIKGRRYAYEQRSYREGKRVRTESRYLGPVGDPVSHASHSSRRRKGVLTKVAELIAANTLTDEERGALAAERFAERVDAYQRATFGETAAERADRERQEFLGDLHDRFGLTLGPTNAVPVEKPSSTIDYSRTTTMPKEETPVAAPQAEASAAMQSAETEAAYPTTEGLAGEAAEPDTSE